MTTIKSQSNKLVEQGETSSCKIPPFLYKLKQKWMLCLWQCGWRHSLNKSTEYNIPFQSLRVATAGLQDLSNSPLGIRSPPTEARVLIQWIRQPRLDNCNQNGLLDWTTRLDNQTGQPDWTTGLDYQTTWELNCWTGLDYWSDRVIARVCELQVIMCCFSCCHLASLLVLTVRAPVKSSWEDK